MTMPGLGGQQPAPMNAPGAGQPGIGVQPGVTAGVIVAHYVIVTGSAGGVFVYSGTPAAGNPPIAWMASAATDPYGNILPSTTGVAGSGTFSAGETVISDAGVFVYSGTPAAGNLPDFVIANGSSLTDPFGGNYLPADVLVDTVPYLLIRDPSTGTYIQMAPHGPAGVFAAYGTGDASEARPAQITTLISGSGAGRTLDSSFVSPQFTGNAAELLLASQSEDNATQGACAVIGSGSGNALYSGDTAAGKPLLQFAADGTLWDIVRSQISTSTVTNANAGTAPITASWPIPAGDMQVGSQYEVEVPFAGEFEPGGTGSPQLALTGYLNGASHASSGIGSGFFPAATAFNGAVKVRLMCTATGVTGTVIMWLDGGLGNAGTRSSGTNNDAAYLSTGPTGALTVDTTAANTLAVAAAWGSSVAGQTITGTTSTLTRTGP